MEDDARFRRDLCAALEDEALTFAKPES